RSSEAVQSGGPVQQSGSEAVRSVSSSGPVVRSGGADQSGPVVRSGGADQSDGAARGEQSPSPDQDAAVDVEAAQAGLVRVEGLVPSLDRCEPDPWGEGWTGGPADQSEAAGVVDQCGVVAQAGLGGPKTGPAGRVEARAEAGGLVRSAARACVADRSGPGACSGVVVRSGGPREAAGLVDCPGGPCSATGLVDRSGGVV